MLVTVPECDVCGKTKSLTNNWFVVIHKAAIKGLGCSRFVVFDWSLRRARQKNAKHICGEGCLSTLISRELANRTAIQLVAKESDARTQLA